MLSPGSRLEPSFFGTAAPPGQSPGVAASSTNGLASLCNPTDQGEPFTGMEGRVMRRSTLFRVLGLFVLAATTSIAPVEATTDTCPCADSRTTIGTITSGSYVST